GIRLGRTTLYPSIELSAASDDNIFQEFQDPTRSSIYDVAPTIRWDIPLSRSLLKLNYQPQLEDYRDNALSSSFNQVLETSLEAEFRNQATLKVSNVFERATRQLQEITSGEVTFTGDRFDQDQFTATYGHPVGRRQTLEVGGRFGTLRFADRNNAAFFDFTEGGLVGAWSVNLTKDLAYRVELQATETTQNRPPLVVRRDPGGPNEELVVLPGFKEDNFSERIYWSGLEGTLGDRFRTRTLLGLGELVFDKPGASSYRGLTLQSQTELRLGRALTVILRAGRRAEPSFFNVSNFFISEKGGVSIRWRTPHRLSFRLGFSRQDNSYPTPVATDLDGDPTTGDASGNDVAPDPTVNFKAGVFRKDRTDSLTAGVDFTLLIHQWSVFIEVSDLNRSSNIRLFDYDQTVARVGLRFGWFQSASGGI
ncbi:MAG: hypothetical protein ACE5ID_11310, partial [Acidobacteriota bacterium]